MVAKQGHVSIMHDVECACKTQWYTIFMLSLAVLGIIIFIILNARKLKLFTSASQYYVPVKLCRTAGSIHLFEITGKFTPEHIELKRYIHWDIIELDWKEVNITFNGNKINLPASVIIPFRDKFKIRYFVRRGPLLFHIMLRQGMTWFSLVK